MQTWRTRRHPLHTQFIHWLINTRAKLKPVSSWNTQRAPWVREINDGSKANLSPQWDWVWHCRSRHLSIILLFLKREQPWFGSSFKCRLGCCTNSKTIYNLKTRYQYSLVWHCVKFASVLSCRHPPVSPAVPAAIKTHTARQASVCPCLCLKWLISDPTYLTYWYICYLSICLSALLSVCVVSFREKISQS